MNDDLKIGCEITFLVGIFIVAFAGVMALLAWPVVILMWPWKALGY